MTAALPSPARPHAQVAVVGMVGLLTAALLLLLPRPLSPDVAGQLWVAERLRDGARLYRDISEINPPLWFWLAVPVDAVAGVLGVRAEGVLITGVAAAALAALLAFGRLLPALPGRRALLVYGAAVLLLMPARDLGQREQLALFGALPWAALIAARREGRRVPVALMLGVAGGAAIGFAFKHYFIAVPLLLEGWLLAGQRRGWRPWRPELLVLAGGALAYGVAVTAVTPDFLRISVPELMLAYRDAPGWAGLLRPAQPVWVLIGAALWGRRLPPAAQALLVAGAGFAVAWALQGKGWPYQSIPTTGLLTMALATALAARGERPGLLAGTALLAPLLLAAVPTQWVPTPATDLAPALADLRAGEAVAVIAVEGRTAWPATIGRGLRFVGRRGSYWMLPAVAAHPGDARLAAFGRRVVREAAADLACLPPRRIVVAPGGGAGPLPFFQRDPAFAAVLAHYRRLDRPGGFDAWELARPFDPSGRADCPRV